VGREGPREVAEEIVPLLRQRRIEVVTGNGERAGVNDLAATRRAPPLEVRGSGQASLSARAR